MRRLGIAQLVMTLGVTACGDSGTDAGGGGVEPLSGEPPKTPPAVPQGGAGGAVLVGGAGGSAGAAGGEGGAPVCVCRAQLKAATARQSLLELGYARLERVFACLTAPGFGDCMGAVTPAIESCTDTADEDCDGEINEEGEGCVCLPNSMAACYSGPVPTGRSSGVADALVFQLAP